MYYDNYFKFTTDVLFKIKTKQNNVVYNVASYKMSIPGLGATMVYGIPPKVF